MAGHNNKNKSTNISREQIIGKNKARTDWVAADIDAR